jgi:hypothetical protein
MLGHEATNTSNRTVFSQPYNSTASLNSVVLKSLKRNGLTAPLDLLWLGVNLLLTLFSTSTKPEHKVQSGLFLDIVVGQGASVLKLLSSEDKTLLIWWDSLLVLDLGLDVVNCV